MKNKLVSLIFIFLCSLSVRAQYLSIDKTTIENKSEQYIKQNNQKGIASLFTVYKILINPDLSPKLDHSMKENLLNESIIVSVVEGTSNAELFLYTKYGTSPSTVKNILYRFNFTIKDYGVSYATKN